MRISVQPAVRRTHVLSCCVTAACIFLLNTVPVMAAEPESEVIAATPGTSYTRSAPAGWRGATRRDEEITENPLPKSILTLRIYKGQDDVRPYYGDRQAYGIDITTQIEECPNGNKRISALNIGGWLYEVDGDCSDKRLYRQTPASEAGLDKEEGQTKAVMQCDPSTWRCRVTGP